METGKSVRQFFDLLLRRRGAASGVVLLFTAILGVFAARVRPDYSIEMAFPRFDASRVDYERFRRDFPFDDATALVLVEAADIFSPEGLRRIAAIENDLGRLEGIVDTQGLTTVRDIVSDGATIRTDLLVPGLDLTSEALNEVKRTATSAPMFAWNLASPDGMATTIQVTLSPDYASKEATRTRFLLNARAVLERHDAAARLAEVNQRLTLSGLPVIRSEFTELINTDLARLFPISLAVILVLLYFSFRSLVDVAAALVTIGFAVVWTVGVMGLCGIPLQVMTQVTPIVVMIVSISDTSHIVTDFREEVRRGLAGREALATACASSALPCLLTEITIAGGFSGLAFNDMVMIQQFGLSTAAGAMLAWLANVTVLPIVLSWSRPERTDVARPGTTFVRTALDRLSAAVERAVVQRPSAVIAVTGLLIMTTMLLAFRVGREYYSYDDLRPSGALYQNLRRVEAAFGGSVPVAVFVERADGRARVPDEMLEPEALAMIDRITRRLRTDYPDEFRNVSSVSDYLRKAHRLFAGDDPAAGELPRSRRLAVQELAAVEDPRVLRNLVSADRSTAAVFAMVPDRGSSRATEVISSLRRYFDEEASRHPYRITITGIYGVADGIYRSLVGGLIRSLGWAILVSFVMFALVLRSVKLALIALIPNLLPLLFVLGIMSLLHIDLKPTTVVIFSIVLVIADDDTIQYLTRFRVRYARLIQESHPEPHKEAALHTLRQTLPPMFITAVSVSVGFSTLMLSEFLGLANLGLLTGVALLAAFVADIFLSPLLLMKLRPRVNVRAGAAELGSRH